MNINLSKNLEQDCKFQVIYYSHNQGKPEILERCWEVLCHSAREAGGRIVAVTHKSMPTIDGMPNCGIVVLGKYGHVTIYKQILAGLTACNDSDIVFLAEHDVLYNPTHFQYMLSIVEANPDKYCYNSNIYHLSKNGFFKAVAWCNWMGALSGKCLVLKKGFTQKLKESMASPLGHPKWAEPGEELGIDFMREASPVPIVDIRHASNLTGTRYAEHSSGYLSEILYWGHKDKFAGFFDA